jgi:hypothetical protein
MAYCKLDCLMYLSQLRACIQESSMHAYGSIKRPCPFDGTKLLAGPQRQLRLALVAMREKV